MGVEPVPAGDAIIDRIVFTRLGPGQLSVVTKGWRCPACGRLVNADTLGDLEHGWYLGNAGRWWVRGTCPGCQARVQFTKAGAGVIRRESAGRMVTTVVHPRGAR